jgi:hypothetical protein
MAAIVCSGCNDGGLANGQPMPTRLGEVFLESAAAVDGGVAAMSAASAFFGGQVPSFACDEIAIGDCHVRACPPMRPGDAPASAGTVVAKGTLQPIVLTPDQDASYSQFSSVTPLWSGGETLTVTADGAEVPRFSVVLTAPSLLVVTMPALGGGQPTPVVDRSRDLQLAWSGSGVGSLYVVFANLLAGDPSVDCSYPASAGRGVVPAAVLEMLSPGKRVLAGRTGAPVAVVPGGGWGVTVWANIAAVSPAGNPFGGFIELQ